MAYENFKDLNRRTAADKVLHDKAFHIAKNPKYDGYEHGLASMVYKFFDKKTSGSSFKNENISNLHPNEYSQQFYYYPFAVKLDRCAESRNTLNDLSNKVGVPNKTED